MKLFRRAALGAALCTILGAAPPAAAQASWQPTRPVEFIVTAGAGGGTDLFARAVQAAITRHNLVPTSIVVSNKGAGSGAEGFVYGRGAQGDPHKVIFGTNNEWLLPLVARVAWKAQDLTPVTVMAYDEFMLWVKEDSPYRSAADLVAAARERPGAIRMGGSQTKDTDQVLTLLVQRATGVRFNYIPFRSGGEAGVQLAGGHIDANTNNPAESIGGWRGGQVRPLCVFRPDPLPQGPRVTEAQAWSDIPTCASQGVPIEEYRMPRTIFLPPGVPPAAQAYWAEVMRRVAETPEWKDYLQRTSQSAALMSPAEMRAMAEREERAAREIYAPEGWLVN
ncbi:Bug family tripartite tricarboxylate transporter substrate binding protein [Muricoccus pecuniae]|uniref:Tripartite-type tricarboxylate transporter receptor subunit TctC n=1 Tax=Muricoccus pecuniae TaxID=693023 RepID=A0A840XYM9_9PROT|nr:tripartite tricarboxylate transporter substrate-binding protein [Roseomonas pecuniae]MBB5692360.1 tripartite-type tricarboxylate transporter receptor subunit TctC [Roseomonas pecuniae]